MGLLIGIIAVIGICGIVASKVIPKLMITVDELLSEGNYEDAFEKAKNDEEKKAVLLENLIAKSSFQISDGLKDPSSFKLSNVYYDGEDEIVFEITGTNSYGANVTNYYDYRYDKDDEEYQLFVYLNSLEEEKNYSWDDSSEKLERSLKNIIRTTVIKLMNDKEAKISYNVIYRINNLFKENKLRDVELIPQISILYPKDNKDSV